MAGEARSDAFMLGAATVMLGPQADLLNLEVSKHSIGLVKNVAVKTAPGFTELTQGVKNTLVASVMTANKATVDGEMFEYTAKNMSYALGLDGTSVVAAATATTVSTAIVAPTPPALTAATLSVTSATGIVANDYIAVYAGAEDQIFIKKVVSIATNTLTLDSGFPVAIPLNAKVQKMNVVAIGSLDDQPYLSCKIVGTLANGDEVIILLPKVRVTSGLSVAFKTDSFDNIPLQMDIYDLVSTDPNYAMFQTVGPQQKPAKAMLLAAK